MVTQLASTGVKFVFGDSRQEFVHHSAEVSPRGKCDRSVARPDIDAVPITHVATSNDRLKSPRGAKRLNPIRRRREPSNVNRSVSMSAGMMVQVVKAIISASRSRWVRRQMSATNVITAAIAR
jgi:hypothetical protein